MESAKCVSLLARVPPRGPNQLIRRPGTPPLLLTGWTTLSHVGQTLFRARGRAPRIGLLLVALALLALLLAGGATPGATSSHAAAQPQLAATTPASSSYLYYNGTVAGNGGTQTLDVPAPANGTVWDLVSAKITITASSPVGGSQNSYLYDSTCTGADVSPAPSACTGIYGPNVDGIANDVMDPGQDGTVVGEGGYTSSAPAGVAIYTHFEQTIHLNHDMFISFGADLSEHVSSTYYLVFDPEVGDFPSFAFYHWSNPIEPLSATPKIVTIPGPPSGHYYRAEIAVSTIDLSSDPGPVRSAEILEEPTGKVLTLIDDWTVRGTGITEDACGGYSASQTCVTDPAGTETVWDEPVLITAGESLEAIFVGVSGDTGVYGVVVTEYPAAPSAPTGLAATAATNSSLTWTWTNPGGTLTDDLFFWQAGATCSSPTEVDLGAVADSLVLGSLAANTEYCAYVEAASSVGTSSASATATGTTAPSGPPGPPTNVVAAPANLSAIQLTWTNPSGPVIDDYLDQYAGSNCSGTPTGLDVGSVVSSYVIGNLSAGATYSYEVAAANVVGEGAWSVCASATTGEPTPPTAPTNLSATAVNSSSIDLVWTNPVGVVSDDYVDTYSDFGCTGAAVVLDLGFVEDSYASGGLLSATTYSFTVEAANSAGSGPASNCALATTVAGNGGGNQTANTTTLELTTSTPLGDVAPDVVAEVDYAALSQVGSVTLGPTNGSGNATYYGLPAGTTITNVTLVGANYSLNSYTQAILGAGVVQLLVDVTPTPLGANNSSAGNWVQFTEQGLPTSATWWVSVTGPQTELLTSTGTTINFELQNGTYQFTVGTSSSLNASEPVGVLVVSNTTQSHPVNFTNLPAATPGSPSSGAGFGHVGAWFWQTIVLVLAGLAVGGAIVVGTFLSARRPSAPFASRTLGAEAYDGTIDLLRRAPALIAAFFAAEWRALRWRPPGPPEKPDGVRAAEAATPPSAWKNRTSGARLGLPSTLQHLAEGTRVRLVATGQWVHRRYCALTGWIRARV